MQRQALVVMRRVVGGLLAATLLVSAVPAAAQVESDAYYSELLSSTAWCSFTYNQRTGASARSRLIFGPDGVMLFGRSAETYTSGPAGSVAGQYGGEDAAYWKVEGAMLWLSEDGTSWTHVPVDLSYNSNGYPILTTEDAEYVVC